MDWGGIIASAMGGGAQAIGQMADHTMQQRDLEQREMRAENRAIEGERRRALLNQEMATEAADRKLKQYVDGYDKVEKRAKEIGTERDVKALQLPENLAGPQVNAEVVDGFSPQQRAMLEKSGQIPKTSGSGLIADKIAAAREIGAPPELRKDLGDEYKQALHGEQTAAAANLRERDLERKETADERRFQTTFMQAQASLQQAAAAAKRAEKSGDAQARADAQTNLNTVISTNMKLIDDAEKKLMILNEKDPKRKDIEDRIERANALIDDAQKGLGGRISGEMDKRKPPPSVSAPPNAIAALKSNPKLAADFDAKYGPGSAKQILGR